MRGRSRGWRVGAWARGEWAELEGRRAERAEGPGMHWGPLKSAEKPRARSHGFSGGAGCVGGVEVWVGGGGGWGLGGGRMRTVWGWGLGVGVEQGPYPHRTSVGRHAGRGMKNVTNTNGARSHGSSGGGGVRGWWGWGLEVWKGWGVGGWGLGVGVEP